MDWKMGENNYFALLPIGALPKGCDLAWTAFAVIFGCNFLNSDWISLVYISFDSAHEQLSIEVKNKKIRFLAIRLWPKM